jgi:hypothetical protein
MKLKQNISDQSNDIEHLSPVLKKLRQDDNGLKVPDGYFDSLSPRIVDGIKKQENSSFLKKLIPSFRKPLVWAPSMATIVVTVLLIFVIPAKKTATIPVVDEWAEINMAYDASYAEEALLGESNTIDKELASSTIGNNEPVSFAKKEPTVDEIKAYLKDHDIETDILNEY